MTCGQCGAPIHDGERHYTVVITQTINGVDAPVLAVVCAGCYLVRPG